MKDIRALTLEELKTELTRLGEKPFRAAQIYDWLHGKMVRSFDEMHNLPADLRKRLAERYRLVTLTEEETLVSKDGVTRKYLLRLPDGILVESVWLRYRHGDSVCISSQAGCRMGCRFCASTINGLERSLEASEMLEQVYAVSRLSGERVSHVVVMGMGEPLDNYENLLRFIRLLSGEGGLHISQRNITVSTCGLAPDIRRLAQEGLQITLALSLHATTDEVRRKLMPVAERYPLEEVFSACDYYFERTGRRITLEYSLIAGVNDTAKDAERLAALAGRGKYHVNLIPVNPVRERSWKSPGRAQVLSFQSRLEAGGVNVTVRREMGRDIDGACGQLRRRRMEREEAAGGA